MSRTIRIALLLMLAAASFVWADPGQSADEGLKPGQPAPPFWVKTLDGQDFYLKDYCGQPRTARTRQERNVVVLSFWATWCKPCKEEIPLLQAMSSLYSPAGVKFYLINVKEPRDSVEACVKERGYVLPVLCDAYEVVAKKYQIKLMPTLAVVDKNGNLAEYHVGYQEGYEKTVKELLDRLTGKKAAPAKGPQKGEKTGSGHTP